MIDNFVKVLKKVYVNFMITLQKKKNCVTGCSKLVFTILKKLLAIKSL